MVKKDSLSKFTIAELVTIREAVLKADSKDALQEEIDRIIKQKEESLSTSLNAQFPVDWFNIDPQNIKVLHDNGIHNLAQLRFIEEAEISLLKGITRSGIEQIAWARDFFDMTPIERIKPEQRDDMTVAKVIVKHANECRKKHPNV